MPSQGRRPLVLNSPGYNAGYGLAGLHDFHLSIEHQVEGEHLAESRWRDEGRCWPKGSHCRLAWQLAKLIENAFCLTFAEKLHVIDGRLLILLGIHLRLGGHIDFTYQKLYVVIALDVVALVLQQAQALLVLVAIAIEAILHEWPT